MHTHNERGIALVLALFLMSALSVLGASLMFLSQTETYATMNYRMMSQARYAGEAGVQKAANFLLDTAQYPVPVGGDPLLACDRTQSPVKCGGTDVVLSWDTAAANYPVAAIKTAFAAASQGTLTAGNTTITYKATATLKAMQIFDSYGGTQSVVQTWEIKGIGGLTGSRNASVEVVAMVETPKVPANSYAAFATANTCGAIHFQGSTKVDSYDSSVGPPGSTPGSGNSTEYSGGDVGTNGNLQIGGSVDVYGNLYSPREGVGTCTEGAVTALTESGSAKIYGADGTTSDDNKPIRLPTAVVYPLPTFAVTPPTNTVTLNTTSGDPMNVGNAANATNICLSLGLTVVVNCTVDAATKTVTIDGHGAEITLPTVSVGSNITMVFKGYHSPAATVNINGLLGNGEIQIDANTVSATNPTGANVNDAVVLKIAGKNPDGTEMATPFDLSAMSWKQNSTTGANKYDASALQIVYEGSATINMQGGNSQSAATIYAPNAAFELQGTQDLYGSILARTIYNHGNASIHYDRRLGHDFYVAGHPMVGSFSWTRQ